MFFEASQNGANRLIFQPEFPVFLCKFKAVARADVIHFVNLCAAVFSTLFVIVFYFIVISFFSICIQIENPNFLGQPATLLPVVLGEIRAYSLKEAILTVSP